MLSFLPAPGFFLAPLRNAESMLIAYTWTEERGLAILPRVLCSEELLVTGE